MPPPEEQSQKLAHNLLTRQPQRALPQALTMFNIGKVSGGLLVVFALVLLWGLSTSNYLGYASTTLTFFALILVPLLFGGILLGVRVGLLNLVEFFCGLTVMPTNMLGGVYQGGRSYQTLALIYSGCGRFNEALKFFRYHENNFNPFDLNSSSPWNERHRVPELLCRMGLDEEAQDCARRNVERAEKDLADFDCLPFRQTLHCDLIVAAMVARDCDQSQQAVHYLERASSSADKLETDTQTRLLMLHADGLLHMYQGRFDEAIQPFKDCCRTIMETRNSPALAHTRNSELLGYTQYYLGQCYFKTGQHDKLPTVLSALEGENKYEPPTSVDKLMLDFTRADYKVSQGKTDEALAILAETIYKISHTQAHFDRYLIEAVKRYQALMEGDNHNQAAEEIKSAIVHLSTSQNLITGKKQLSPEQPQATLLPAPKLPDVRATGRMANRAVFLFLAVLGYTVVAALTHPDSFNVGGWGILCCMTLLLAAIQIKDQVNNRRCRALAAEALQRGGSVEVVVSPQSSILGAAMVSCVVDEGPPELVGRKLEMTLNNNLIYASQAAQAAPKGKIKARLYQEPGGKRILAIETMGRILTVKKPRFFDRAPSSLKLCL